MHFTLYPPAWHQYHPYEKLTGEQMRRLAAAEVDAFPDLVKVSKRIVRHPNAFDESIFPHGIEGYKDAVFRDRDMRSGRLTAVIGEMEDGLIRNFKRLKGFVASQAKKFKSRNRIES